MVIENQTMKYPHFSKKGISSATFYFSTAVFLMLSTASCELKTETDFTPPVLTTLPVPCQSGGEPNLHIAASGMPLLSWVEFLNDTTDALVFSKLENGAWSSPQTIATGSNWFVNWADFPSVATYHDDENAMAAHWLQMSAEGTYDYDVRIAQSADGGKTWAPSFVPHTDGVQAEHGFVSLLPLPDGRMFATWLDGRNTVGGEQEEAGGHDHGHGGPMTLRCAAFDKNGRLTDEAELDNKVCDCCQTAAVLTASGPVVAYRNRSDEENRDIYFTKKTADGWTPPKAVFADNWHITGCPVNGPALAAFGETLALAWFTAAGEQPKVKVAFSKNGGETFGPPVQVDNGKPEGRVDVIFLNETTALVVWLEQVEGGGEIRAAEVTAAGQRGADFLIAKTSASRQSGFPRVEKAGNRIIFAWTEVPEGGEGGTKIQSAFYEIGG